MNQPTAIIVIDGMGRPENPFSKYSQNPTHRQWFDFEQSITEHPCPSIANTEPGKTVMAELRWQFYNKYGEYWTDCSQKTAEDYCNGVDTRQIWVPVEQKPTNYLYEKYKDMPLTNSDRERKRVEQKEGEGKFGEWVSVAIKMPPKGRIIIWNLLFKEASIIEYDEEDLLQYFKHWMPCPNSPHHQ